MTAGEYDQAEQCFRAAIRIAPDVAELYVNLGLILEKRADPLAAENCYRQAIGQNANLTEAHLNLGVLLAAQKRFQGAESAYLQALYLVPDSVSAWSNLGVLYACMKRENEAEDCYRHAMQLNPHHALAQFNLSYLLLRQGRFTEGWKYLDQREWLPRLQAHLGLPRWQGEALAGRSILMGIEAGHGDMIQFCRFASELKKRGAARVGLLCHPALKTLFSTLAGVDTIYALDEPLSTGSWDFWVAPMSIPRHCEIRLETIPASLPYLFAPVAHLAKWQNRLPLAGFRVGLVWKGNPKFDNDADRSLPSLATLAPLAEVKGVHFISLQKGAGEQEILPVPAGMNLHQWDADISDFADTAAIMTHLDLVISVDTAAAHLAGALGIPCWVLLPDYKTDWRWLTARTDSPWYPGVMRLFRQTKMGHWTDVVLQLREALEQESRRRAGEKTISQSCGVHAAKWPSARAIARADGPEKNPE